jgi:hypothetical protein
MNLKHTHDTITTLVAPAARQGGTTNAPSGGVRLARGLDAPTSGVRLVRGLDAPSGEVRLARGLKRPLGRGPPRSRAQHPLGEVRLARGLNAPSGEVRLARGHLHAHRPCSCPCVRAFNALTPRDAHHDPDAPENRVPALFHQLPREGHPRHCVALCGEAGVSRVTLCRLPPYG